MECNRDEAIRAKEIAERKFTEKNYAAAKKFASKARNLYPQLEGLNQMLITIDVFISFENKINGEVDWYGILSVNHLADDDTIKKQFRKLALVLHPDKNKSLGAEDAFKLVSEAWSLLSNKTKRLAYNQKRNLKEFQQKVQPQTGRPTVPPGATGYDKFTRSVNSNVRNQEIGSMSIPPVKKTGTFWTICNKCKTYYEYLRIYLNHTLLCQKCHEAFMALEKGLPPHVSKSSNMYYCQQSQKPVGGNQFNSGRNCPAVHGSEPGMSSGINSSCKTNSQRASFSKTTVADTTFGQKYGAAHSVSMNQLPSEEKVKREREERQCTAELGRSEFLSASSNASLKPDMPWKKRKIEDIYLNDHRGLIANQGLGKGNSGIDTVFRFTDMHNMPERNRELPYPEIKNMLMFKARTEIGRRIKKRSSVTMEEAKCKQKNEEKDKVKNQKSTTKNDTGNIRCNESVIFDNKPEACDSIYNVHKEDNSPLSINVPDPDFHNFDLDRTEGCFRDDQVWAAYDDDDGMPRYYARIHKVMSLTPLKMRISWLNSKNNSELGPLDWIGSGFTKTCGEFRTSRRETATTLNSFSHKVSWKEGPRGLIQIYPRKGEVWALYRNWSLEWNKHTSDEVIHKYDMVEVLDDFVEEQGVCVTRPLVKVAGFKTLFYLQLDPKEVTRVPKEEMFRFSHQVPNYQLTGEEAHNAPKGCFELDPAALPLELLQVTTKANDATTIEKVSITEEVAS